MVKPSFRLEFSTGFRNCRGPRKYASSGHLQYQLSKFDRNPNVPITDVLHWGYCPEKIKFCWSSQFFLQYACPLGIYRPETRLCFIFIYHSTWMRTPKKLKALLMYANMDIQ